jgi:hypothetical protein
MPGRDELIQQNLNRAQQSINSAGGSSSAGSGFSNFLNGITQPVTTKSIFGANYDVAAALESINFIPYSFGEMRGDVAYIRRWKRAGQPAVTRVPPPSGFSNLGSELSRTLNSLIPGVQLGSGISQLFGGTPTPTTPFNPNIIAAQRAAAATSIPVNTTAQAQTQTPSITQITTNTAQAPQGTTTGTTTGAPSIFGGLAAAATNQLSGLLYSANPGGSLAGWVGPITRAFGGPTIYSGKGILGFNNSISAFTSLGGTVGRIPQSSILQEGIWQFLFNPSELEISAGPEFNKMEAWGVSEKENSGQPLQWSRNKNAEIKFNDILLNGYVFGKKVDDLEQGIFDLFMAREGKAGQHGPDILEFVWGKRTFGPCVIKDISIKEKMWDQGLVVNATVSFTLEQIPEWTINDGFADIARPGREPLQSTPVPQPASTPEATPEAPTTPADTSQKPQPEPQPQPQPQPAAQSLTPEQIVQKCNGLAQNYSNLNNIKSTPFFGQSNTQTQDRLASFYTAYNDIQSNQFAAISNRGFTPQEIIRQVNTEWDRQINDLRTRYGSEIKDRDINAYPREKANGLISEGISYQLGGIAGQIRSNCPNTARSLGLNAPPNVPFAR